MPTIRRLFTPVTSSISVGRVQRLLAVHINGHCGAGLIYADVRRVVLLDSQVRSRGLEESPGMDLRMCVGCCPLCLGVYIDESARRQLYRKHRQCCFCRLGMRRAAHGCCEHRLEFDVYSDHSPDIVRRISLRALSGDILILRCAVVSTSLYWSVTVPLYPLPQRLSHGFKGCMSPSTSCEYVCGGTDRAG